MSAGGSAASRDGKIEIVWRELSWFKPNKQNPRKHTKKQVRAIARSIEKHGILVPAVCSPDGELISGHGRIQAAYQLRLEKYPVIIYKGSTADKLALMAALNYIYSLAPNDWDIIQQDFRDAYDDFMASLADFRDDVGEVVLFTLGEMSGTLPGELYQELLDFLEGYENWEQTLNLIIEVGLNACETGESEAA